jgi:hypothetical protein
VDWLGGCRNRRPQPRRGPRDLRGNDFKEAEVAGVTTSAGWYTYVSDVMGLAYIGWLLIVGTAMMRLKLEAIVPQMRERELKEAG